MSGMDRLTELLPCPFCGGEAELVHIEEGENAGGSCVCCTQCMASGNVEFGFKENYIAAWNRRASQAAPAPSDGLREALSDMIALFSADGCLLKGTHLNATLARARAALSASPAQEGG